MRRHTLTLLALALLAGCQAAPKSASEREALRQEAVLTVDIFKRTDPAMQLHLDKAVGVAVFPEVTKGAAALGGAYGQGVLFESGRAVGFCDLAQATIGLQLGGQTYREVIIFSSPAALSRFKAGTYTFSAQTSAVALKPGASADVRYEEGVAVLTLAQSGLMYEASVGGQRFSYQSN